MRKTVLTMVMALLCLMIVFLTTGCNEEKDLQLGKMEEQIKTLRLENARLKKEQVITEINDTGTDMTLITIVGVFIVTNNLIWWVVARRKRDENFENIQQ